MEQIGKVTNKQFVQTKRHTYLQYMWGEDQLINKQLQWIWALDPTAYKTDWP